MLGLFFDTVLGAVGASRCRCAAGAATSSRPFGRAGRPRRALRQPAGDAAAHHGGSTVAVERQHLADRAIEEHAVVADDHDDAGPVVEELLERAQRVEVEIVRRLVEQQHVGLLDQREQQLQAPALAARQRADRRELRVAVEPELAHQLDVVERGLALVAGDGVAHALVQVEVAAELVVVADLDRAPDLDRALRRLQPAGDEIEQRALAGAVGADDADAIARFEHVVERLQDEQRSGVATGRGRAGHEKPTPWSSTPFDPNRVLPSDRPSSPSRALACGTAREERVGGVDARLRLRRARRRAAPQPRELASGEVLARLLLGRGLRFAFDARREVCRVSGSARPFLRNVEVASRRGRSRAPCW